jgi:hypothetical protein
MIIICEPQCKGISHEQVNGGFIYGLRLAYPKEKIVFFADLSHFETLKKVWDNRNKSVRNIEHIPINFNADKSFSLGGLINYFFLLKRIFKKAVYLGADKIFFLSDNPIILFVIKLLKQNKKFKNIGCTFVQHGELEDIANTEYKKPFVPIIKKDESACGVNLKEIITKLYANRHNLLPFVVAKISQPFKWLYAKYSLIFRNIFRVKRVMEWKHSSDYKYIVLSPHIVKNAGEYIDVNHLNFHTVIMPVIFADPLTQADNAYVKFAIFGYGERAQMYEMLKLLSTKTINQPYEIRIISMDRGGTAGFPNITYVGKGGVLSRGEMENSARDIDIFINLYDASRHKMGCSGSIFEALSYLKPVLHLSNDGYNFFNKKQKPIGFRCESLKEFVEKMCDIIENYNFYKKEITVLRNNIVDYRREYAIENNLEKLKEAFTFK